MANENKWGSGDTKRERERRLRAHERELRQESAEDLARRYGIAPPTSQSRMAAYYGNALKGAYGSPGQNLQRNLGVVPAGEAVTITDDQALIGAADQRAERANRRANRKAQRELRAAAAAGGRFDPTISDDDILRSGV